MKIKQFIRGISTLKKIKERPVEFFVDLLLGAVLSALIPIPFIGQIIVKYKGMILSMLAGLILVFIMILAAAGIALFTPLIFLVAPHNSSLNSSIGIQNGSIPALNGYIDSAFSSTDIPQKNPFGGEGMFNTYTTVNYHDQESLEINGEPYNGIEQGIDIVPDGLYFLTNKAAQLSGGLPIIFSTMNGTANEYTDQYGALYVVVINKQNSVETLYIHLSQFLIGENTQVQAGEPIGVMGSTGLSTGPHLEYQVRLNQNGTFVTQNPVEYIH